MSVIQMLISRLMLVYGNAYSRFQGLSSGKRIACVAWAVLLVAWTILWLILRVGDTSPNAQQQSISPISASWVASGALSGSQIADKPTVVERIPTPKRNEEKLKMRLVAFLPLLSYGAEPVFLKKFRMDGASSLQTEDRVSIDFTVAASPDSLADSYVKDLESHGWWTRQVSKMAMSGSTASTYTYALRKGALRYMLIFSPVLNEKLAAEPNRSMFMLASYPDNNVLYRNMPNTTRLEVPPLPKEEIFWKGAVGYVPNGMGQYSKQRSSHIFVFSGSLQSVSDTVTAKLRTDGFSVTEQKRMAQKAPSAPVELNSAPVEPASLPIESQTGISAGLPPSASVSAPAPVPSALSVPLVPKAPIVAPIANPLDAAFLEAEWAAKRETDPKKMNIPESRQFYVLQWDNAYSLMFSDSLVGMDKEKDVTYVTIEIGVDAFQPNVEYFQIEKTGFSRFSTIAKQAQKYMSYSTAKIANDSQAVSTGASQMEPIVVGSTLSASDFAAKLEDDFEAAAYKVKRLVETENEIQLEAKTQSGSILAIVRSPVPFSYSLLLTGSTSMLDISAR